MGEMVMDISVKREVRTCYVRDRKALFHGWYPFSKIIEPSMLKGGHHGGVINYVLGIVEFEDGTVGYAGPEDVRFADGGEFNERIFAPVKEEEDIFR